VKAKCARTCSGVPEMVHLVEFLSMSMLALLSACADEV